MSLLQGLKIHKEDRKRVAKKTECFEHDVDYQGNDVAQFDTLTAAECQTKCQGNSQCKFFSWSPRFTLKPSKGRCDLKSSDAGRTSFSDRISGPHQCQAGQMLDTSAQPPKNLAADLPGNAVCISEWTGRLGNNLRTLEYAMEMALANNIAYVKFPQQLQSGMSSFLDLPADGALRVLTKSAAAALSTRNAEQDDDSCAISCLYEKCSRTKTAGARVATQKRSWTVSDATSHFHKYLVDDGLLKCNPDDSAQINNETLIMHMRSGDISQRYDYHFEQPPCAFYEKAMSQGNQGGPYSRGLIVTEADMENPCIQHMLDRYPNKIKVQSTSVRADACTIAGAHNLAIAHGTWGAQLQKLNTRLAHLFVPDIGNQIQRSVAFDGGLPYVQHMYHFPGFSQSGWKSVEDKVRDMLSFNVSSIEEKKLAPFQKMDVERIRSDLEAGLVEISWAERLSARLAE